MITPCKKCGTVILVPPGIPISTLRWLYCPNGHAQLVVGMPSTLEPTRVDPTKRAFPWLRPFP